MKTYQIIIQSDEDIDGIDFQSQDGEKAKVLSIIDISTMFSKELTDYAKLITMSDDVGEA